MKLLNLIIISLISLQVFALQPKTQIKNINTKQLIAQIRSKLFQNKLKAETAARLLKFSVSPNQPLVKQEVTIFMQPLTSFTDSDLFLESTFDGINITSQQEHPTKDLWIFNAGQFTEVKSHTLATKIFIQDKNAAALLTEAITNLDAQITALDEQIAIETDPAVLVQLNSDRADKLAQKNDLIQTLASLKTEIATEVFNFEITQDLAQAEYPKVFSVKPGALKLNTVTPIQLTGQNLQNATVKVAGQQKTVISQTATTLNFDLQLPLGLHDLEVITVDNNQIKNVILKNAFFVTTEISSNPYTPPNAVTSTSQNQIGLGSTATVSAANSFDSGEHTLRYEWRFITVPTGSNQTVTPTPINSNQNFNFTPNIPGFYVLELRVLQNELPFLASAPAYVTIQVLAPANRTPIAFPSISNINVQMNQAVQFQITVNDLDFWQKHTFFIQKQSAFGTATINQTGSVSFTAGAAVGNDVLEILVVDNGDPALSAVVMIPTTITSSNQSPMVSSIFTQNRSQGLPIQTLVFPLGLGDPDGFVTEVKVVMGDGTTEYAPTTGVNTGVILHNYHAYGNYNATMYVKDNQGAVTTIPFVISVVDTDLPVAKFSLNQYSCAVPCAISVDASASSDSNGISQYRWLWGDNPTEEVGGNSFMTRTHTYNNPGVYRIRLRVRDQYSAQSEGFAFVYVGVTAPATGSASSIAYIPISPREVLINTPITLDAARSFDPNPSGFLSNFNWNFNCETGSCTGTGSTTSVTYTTPTNFNPTLTVTNALGGTSLGYSNMELYVVNSGHAPKAILKANNQVILGTDIVSTAPLTINFDSSLSYDYDGSIQHRDWYFGDNTFNSDNVQTVQKTYATAGVYFMQLKVTDNSGNYNRFFQKIIVNPAKSISNKRIYKIRSASDSPGDSGNDYEQGLSNICGAGNGQACFELAKIYEQRGDTFVSDQLKQRSCQLGYILACDSMKAWK